MQNVMQNVMQRCRCNALMLGADDFGSCFKVLEIQIFLKILFPLDMFHILQLLIFYLAKNISDVPLVLYTRELEMLK